MNPSATNHPVSYFRKFHSDGELDLTPSFQRKPVWTDEQSSYLIDSILNNLPIPEIFVRSITNNEGHRRLEVIDGQQRLRSIIRFFTGDLELAGDKVTSAWTGASWDTLTDAQRQSFWNFKLVVRELENASDTEVRDMFRRLNANQSNLNDQELRHSQYDGEFISFVEDLADDSWWLTHGVVSTGQIRRMIDAEFISELLVGLIAGPLNKKLGLEEFYRDFNNDFPDQDKWRKAFLASRSKTLEVTQGTLRGWNTKTEFYSLFLACGRFVLRNQRIPKVGIDRLGKFKKLVDEAKRKESTKRQYPKLVEQYVDAATRASTDLQRRVARIDALWNVLRTGGGF